MKLENGIGKIGNVIGNIGKNIWKLNLLETGMRNIERWSCKHWKIELEISEN